MFEIVCERVCVFFLEKEITCERNCVCEGVGVIKKGLQRAVEY